MSCQGFDIREYTLGELPEAGRLEASRHFSTCEKCAGELEQFQLLVTALKAVPDQEPPQRIAFVSDKVFEPSLARRWWQAFWLSGARLGFASAAILSVALLVSAWRQPEVKTVETRMVASAPVNVNTLVEAATEKAVAKAVAEQERKMRALLAAAEQKHELEQRALNLRVEASFEILQKRYAVMRTVAMNYGDSQQ